MKKGALDKRIRIERPVADTSLDGAGSGTWAIVGEAWAEIQDVLPSRSERLSNGINLAARPARVRMLHRTDVDASMRLVQIRNQNGVWIDVRVMQIVAGPAEVGNRSRVEFVVEEYNSTGNAA